MLSDISGLFESEVLEFIFHLKLLLANHIERYFPSLPRILHLIRKYCKQRRHKKVN